MGRALPLCVRVRQVLNVRTVHKNTSHFEALKVRFRDALQTGLFGAKGFSLPVRLTTRNLTAKAVSKLVPFEF